MADQEFVRRTRLDASPEEVFAWHERPEAFEDLAPPWEPVEILERTGSIRDEGSRVVIRMKMGPIPLKWIAEHRDCIPGVQFRDIQISGPFARWEHTHRFESDGNQGCWLEDRVVYRLPGGFLGQWLGGKMTKRKLNRLFDHRHRVTATAFSQKPAPGAEP